MVDNVIEVIICASRFESGCRCCGIDREAEAPFALRL